MTFKETLDFLYKSLPMFQRQGKIAFKNDLTNTIALCEFLDNPHLKFKSIHIAGTNGKGSTAHSLAAILQIAGYKTGLYTSPHLKSFRERIKINGEMISEEEVINFVDRIHPLILALSPSFFEITVAMAFDCFVRQQVDIAIIEVGLGGRLDSTNVIFPILSVITNISLDHTDLLGHTLEEIALEKAGIIKKNTPVVISEKQPEISEVFIDKALKTGSKIYFADENFSILRNEAEGFDVLNHQSNEIFANISMDLKGDYQRFNLPGILQTVNLLIEQDWHISTEHIRVGMSKLTTLTGLRGRWQVLNSQPLMICDVAHNFAGINSIVQWINRQQFPNVHIILGMVKDKNIREILQILPQKAQYYYCNADIPRALLVDDLIKISAEEGLKGKRFENVNDAIESALNTASKDDFIFIGGSTFIVAEINNL